MTPLHQQRKYFSQLRFPVYSQTEAWKEKIKRLHLLLTVKESAMDVPSNLEARRRLTFFSNSLFMDMPPAPKIRNMLSFSVLTPYFSEDVLFSIFGLEQQNEDGVSILFYLQKIFPGFTFPSVLIFSYGTVTLFELSAESMAYIR
jgi:callose synthase